MSEKNNNLSNTIRRLFKGKPIEDTKDPFFGNIDSDLLPPANEKGGTLIKSILDRTEKEEREKRRQRIQTTKSDVSLDEEVESVVLGSFTKGDILRRQEEAQEKIRQQGTFMGRLRKVLGIDRS